ncbi:hypothetical protein C8R42DRAFT_722014 [Lentinula raphanica]|nr:hypothetical protein C8R42DRAFT_722014 [Lentinula raphanica]
MRVPGGLATDSDSESSDMDLDPDQNNNANQETPQHQGVSQGSTTSGASELPQTHPGPSNQSISGYPAPVEEHGVGQTPPQPKNATMADLQATPRASDFREGQPSMQPPPSPTAAPPASKKRRAHTPPPQPSQSSGSSGQGMGMDMLKALLDQQTKMMQQLYTGIRNSNVELANKQSEQINTLASSVQQNSAVLGQVVEKLDVLSAKNKRNVHQGNATVNEDSERRQGDGGQDTAAFSSGTKKQGSARSGEEVMRKWFNEVMENRDLYRNEVTQDEADQFAEIFKKDPLARPCTAQNFRYWIAGVPKSAWNKGASYVFIEILEQKRLIPKPDLETRDRIREAFFVRLKTLRGYWLEKQKMQDDKSEPSAVSMRRRQRKYNLFHRRRDMINTVPELEPFLQDFDQLGVGGMSSDEEDSEMSSTNMRYKIKAPYWRSRVLAKWLRLLDFVHLEGRCSVDSEGTTFGFTRGAAPRLRVDNDDRTSKSTYVAGLPVNFYDAEWLENQEPGWAKGGAGFVNQIIRPRPVKHLVFPADLAKVLSQRKYPGVA